MEIGSWVVARRVLSSDLRRQSQAKWMEVGRGSLLAEGMYSPHWKDFFFVKVYYMYREVSSDVTAWLA